MHYRAAKFFDHLKAEDQQSVWEDACSRAHFDHDRAARVVEWIGEVTPPEELTATCTDCREKGQLFFDKDRKLRCDKCWVSRGECDLCFVKDRPVRLSTVEGVAAHFASVEHCNNLEDRLQRPQTVEQLTQTFPSSDPPTA